MAAMEGSSAASSSENVDRRLRPSPERNEVRITQQGKTYMYISHAQSLLTEKGADSITIKALGRAINKAVTIAEILKRRVSGLHQISEISSTELAQHQQQHHKRNTDEKTDEQSGNDNKKEDEETAYEYGRSPSPDTTATAAPSGTRRVSAIAITLSFSPLDTSHIGYQAPLPPEQLNLGGGRRGPVRGRPGERGGFTGRGRGRGWNRMAGRDIAPGDVPAGGSGVNWNRGSDGGSGGQIFQPPLLDGQQGGAQQPWFNPALGYGQQQMFDHGYAQSPQILGMIHGQQQEQVYFPHQQQQQQQQEQQQQQQQQLHLQDVRYATSFGGVQPVVPYQMLAANNAFYPQQAYQHMLYGRGGVAPGYPAAAPGLYGNNANVVPAVYTATPPWGTVGAYGNSPQFQQVPPQWSGPNLSAPIPGRGGIGRGDGMVVRGGRGRGSGWRGGFQGRGGHVQPSVPSTTTSTPGNDTK